MHLEVAEPYLLNSTEAKVFNRQDDFYAVVGIGFPQRFYRTLEGMGVQQFQCHEFADHHEYELEDLVFDDANPIITTEKDAVKILALLKQNPSYSRDIWVVPVDAVLSAACYDTLHQQLASVGIKIS